MTGASHPVGSGARPRSWLAFLVIAHLLLLVEQARFAARTPLYLDDLPPVASMLAATRAGRGDLNGLVADQLTFFQSQGRFQPVAAAVRYPVAFRVAADRPAFYHLYSLAVHAGVLVLLGVLVWQLTALPALVVAVTAVFAAYPHTKEPFLQFNSNGGVFESVFLLGAMVTFIAAIRRGSRELYALSVVSWACALSAYEQSYPFFLLFPILALWAGTPRDRRLARLAMHGGIFFAAVGLMQVAHSLAVPAYSENVILDPGVLYGRLTNMVELLKGQFYGTTLWDDRALGWGLPGQRALARPDYVWVGVIVLVFALALWSALREETVHPIRRATAAFGFGLIFCLTGAAYVVFREGAGWYSRHHYTTAIGLALMHGALLCVVAGARRLRVVHALAAIVLGAAMTPMLLANVRSARAIAIWGDNLETMRQEMLRLAPQPALNTDIVVLGDVIDQTGWVASDGGTWFPQIWYRRADVVGRMGNGDERFVALGAGWHWLELNETPLTNYGKLLLFRLDHGHLRRIDRLDLESEDGSRRIIELRAGSSTEGATEHVRVAAVPRTKWSWNR